MYYYTIVYSCDQLRVTPPTPPLSDPYVSGAADKKKNNNKTGQLEVWTAISAVEIMPDRQEQQQQQQQQLSFKQRETLLQVENTEQTIQQEKEMLNYKTLTKHFFSHFFLALYLL